MEDEITKEQMAKKRRMLRSRGGGYHSSDAEGSSMPKEDVMVSKGSPAAFDYSKSGQAAAKSMSGGGSGGDILASGLMASGNPYAMGAGLGLMAYSASRRAKREQKQAEYVAEVSQKKNVSDLLQRLSNQFGTLKL